MRHHDVISLISIKYEEDEIGNQIPVETERQVFANEFSVSSSEFYNASVAGLKPTRAFEIYSFEYQGEGKLKHEGTKYQIIRTEKRGEKMRLTCERDVGNG